MQRETVVEQDLEVLGLHAGDPEIRDLDGPADPCREFRLQQRQEIALVADHAEREAVAERNDAERVTRL
jgi:hypothetical protein